MVDLMDMGSCSGILDMVQLDQHSSFILYAIFRNHTFARLCEGCITSLYILKLYLSLSDVLGFCVFVVVVTDI